MIRVHAAVVIGCILCESALAMGADVTAPRLHWKDTYQDPDEYWCGPHCLYIFLQMSGFNISYDDVHSTLGASPEGTDLRRLQEAATSLGAPSRVVRGDFDTLLASPKPALIHVSDPTSDRKLGHYIVIYGVTPAKAVRFVDGEIGECGTYSRETLTGMWKGYSLVLDRSEPVQLSDIFLYGVSLMAAAVGVTYLVRARKSVNPVEQKE